MNKPKCYSHETRFFSKQIQPLEAPNGSSLPDASFGRWHGMRKIKKHHNSRPAAVSFRFRHRSGSKPGVGKSDATDTATRLI